MKGGRDADRFRAQAKPFSKKLCRNDPGIVEDQDIAGPEDGRKIPHRLIPQAFTGTNPQEPRRISGLYRTRRNSVRWEVKIEQLNPHGPPVSPTAIGCPAFETARSSDAKFCCLIIRDAQVSLTELARFAVLRKKTILGNTTPFR